MADKAIIRRGGEKGNVAVWCGATLGAVFLLNVAILPQAVAGPDGGQVVGGSGSISAVGNTTTINQASQNMAIDWQSYNVNATVTTSTTFGRSGLIPPSPGSTASS